MTAIRFDPLPGVKLTVIVVDKTAENVIPEDGMVGAATVERKVPVEPTNDITVLVPSVPVAAPLLKELPVIVIWA